MTKEEEADLEVAQISAAKGWCAEGREEGRREELEDEAIFAQSELVEPSKYEEQEPEEKNVAQIDLEHIEKMWETQDKFRLLTWGLRQRQCIMFREQFLMSTDHLKDKFRILLGRWLTKRSERQFAEMMDII